MKESNNKGNRIFVVDDNPDNLGVVAGYLKSAGYKVAVAPNGTIALERAARIMPVVILLDVKMPGMNGFEVCREMKKDTKISDIPIIFLTALDDVESITKGFQVGGTDYLSKPVNKDELLARVSVHKENYLYKNQLKQEVRRRTAELEESNQLLIESDSVLRATLESTEDGVLVVGKNGKISHYNKRFSEIWSVPDDLLATGDDNKLIEFVLSQLVEPEQFTAMIRELNQSSKASEDILNFKDGRILERYSHPLVRDGQATGRVWFFRNITARKRAEEALQKFQFTIDQAPDAVFWIDREKGLTYVNEQASRSLGYTLKELKPMPLWSLEPGSSPDCRDEEWEKFQKDDQTRTFHAERIQKRRDGSVFPVEVLAKRLWFEESELLVAFVRDISNRKRAQEELARYQGHLEDLVEERTKELQTAQEELLKQERLAVLGQLTATVSHELRNPLGVVRSSVFYLKRILPHLDDRIAKHLNRIDEQVLICDGIVEDLLEYTRGRQSEKVKGEITPWMNKMLNNYEGLSGQIELDCRLADDLPPIFFDQEKIRRVMVNLITNAAQAIATKQDATSGDRSAFQPRIRISTRRANNSVIIQVEDNGIGMDRETCRQAFNALFTTRARGTGLGLAIVEKIINEHDGRISLESTLQKGTKIVLELPISDDSSI